MLQVGRLMLLGGPALGASPPQNLCSLASVPFGAMVIRHGPYTPHPPLMESKNQLLGSIMDCPKPACAPGA